MIQRLSHTNIYVHDQERAKAFYTEKLGFEVRQDERLGDGFRWLTVGPEGQPDVQLILSKLEPSSFMPERQCNMLREIQSTVGLSGGVFDTPDCQKTYEELVAKGVEFLHPPSERPYGIEALLKDDSGNWFSMVQRPR